MPEPIVGIIESIETPNNQPIPEVVSFDDQESWPWSGPAVITVRVKGTELASRLELARPQARVDAAMLADLAQHGWPVHLDIDHLSAGNVFRIANVRAPYVARVRRLKRLPGGDVEVALYRSSAPHRLRAGSPRFREFARLLAEAKSNQARVVMTISDCPGEIGYLRLAADSEPDECEAETLPKTMKKLPQIEASVTKVAGHTRAQELFLAMHALGCDSRRIDRRCTPFAYPADGCHARAHQMCERLRYDHGVIAAKIWLYASGTTISGCLSPKTRNAPGCGVDWAYHVAPVVRITQKSGDAWRVLDPALFSASEEAPTITAWKARQRDKLSFFKITEAPLFDRPASRRDHDDWDPSFACAPRTLAKYRVDLIRQIKCYGFPPYC